MKNYKLIDKQSVFIDKNVKIGKGVIIYENVRIEGDSVIEDGVVIRSNSYIADTHVGKNTVVEYSHLTGAIVGENCSIGPFARLRPNSVVGDFVKVGNFVEIKNATIGKNTKISHLAYVGDAILGESCNVGCGAIFVNYDGKSKNKTTVGDGCFIGSNCNIIAPVNIKNGAYICAGTTVTKDVNNDDFVIGRVRQEVKEKRAHIYLKGE